MHHFDYIDRILRSSTLSDIQRTTAEFSKKLGFDNYAYAAQRRAADTRSKKDVFFFHDFKNEWSKSYLALSDPEHQRIDPRVIQARTGVPAGAWNRYGHTNRPTPNDHLQKQIERSVRLSGEFGISAGISVPVNSSTTDWGFVALTTNSLIHPKELETLLPISVYFSSCMQSMIDRMQLQQVATPHLTNREREILRWAAIGKTSWEISTILRISERTVNFHLAQAAAKLHVKGRRAACARAVALGLILV